jgi:hypothetical protein
VKSFQYSKLLHLVYLVDWYFVRVSPIRQTSVYLPMIGSDKTTDLLLEHINNLLHTLSSLHLNLNSDFLQHLKLSRRSDIRSTVKTRDESSSTACFPTLHQLSISTPGHESVTNFNLPHQYIKSYSHPSMTRISQRGA